MPPPAEGFATRFVLGPALRTQPDRRLVALVREGYETAFEEIVRRYGRPLTRYAAAIVGSRGEDVTQDAFSKALLALRRGDAEIELRPWLFRIVRNTALNELRDRPPSPEILAEAIAGGGNPAEELERREELADLMRRLQSLPEPQRAAIVMRELEGLSHEEIAATLGLSGGAARQAIFRARQALRNGLGFLLPLPIVRLLIDHGSEAAIAGVSAGGATAAAGGVVGGAGAGMALKAGVVTVVLAGSVGTGIALNENRGHKDADAAAASPTERPTNQVATLPPAPPLATTPNDDSGGAARGDDGEPGHGGGGANSGPGNASDEDRVIEPSQSRASDDSGPGPSSKSGRGQVPGDPRDDRHGGRSGPGPGDGDDHSGSGPDGDSHSGHGSGGARSGSGVGGDGGGESSGPGSGGERSADDLVVEQPPPEEGAGEDTEDHSGSGSGSSSGSGSGDDRGDDDGMS